MSAQPVESPDDRRGAGVHEVHRPAQQPAIVEVRRSAVLSALIAVAASGIAIAYLWRAVETQVVWDWVLCAGLAGIAAAYFVALLDARTPLLVADELGVRIRLGQQWRGVPWEAVEEVRVVPRRGLRDGRLVVSLRNVARAIEGLGARARRHAASNRRLHGAPLAVPLGLTTRVVAGGDGPLEEQVAALSAGRTAVVALLGGTGGGSEPRPEPEPDPGGRLDAGDGTTPGASGAGPAAAPDGSVPRAAEPSQGLSAEARVEARVGLSADPSVETVRLPPGNGPVAEVPLLPVAAVAPGDSRVRPLARLREPVEPLVIDDYVAEPAYDPVIGPELAAARVRVGLSVDELAERTRIRPHVIESIEVDDFGPCGGDVYARGHIRTLARVLGKEAAPLLEHFERRYASAPVSARRVFEAELATGMTGSMRSTSGGPSWGLLVAAVVLLGLVWGAARLMAGGEDLPDAPAPLLPSAAGLGDVVANRPALPVVRPVAVTLEAANATTAVQVEDGDGTVVFEGDLPLGESLTLTVDPPVRVSAENGGALTVAVDGKDQGYLGTPDAAAVRTFTRSRG